jgi:hypothetical protein
MHHSEPRPLIVIGQGSTRREIFERDLLEEGARSAGMLACVLFAVYGFAMGVVCTVLSGLVTG